MEQPNFPDKYRTLIESLRQLTGKGLVTFKDDFSLLQRLWDEYKLDFSDMLSKIGMEDSLNIRDCKFAFHLNENYQFSYDPTSNCLELNILSFFFHINPDDDRIFFDMDYKMAGLLIHEIDHYHYSKEHGVIGWSEDERDDFDKEHLHILEKRAYEQQLTFLKKYREICDEKIALFELMPDAKVRYLIEDIDNYLEDSISFINNTMKLVEENAGGYIDFGGEQSRRVLNRIGKLFNIPLEQTEKPTNTILIKF